MKNSTKTALTLLSLVLTANISFASNLTKSPINYTNLNLQGSCTQHSQKLDTTSYWVAVNNMYYVAFTKDTVADQWVYKANKPAASVKNADQLKKAPGTVVGGGRMIRINLGNKTFIFRPNPADNSLNFMTAIPYTPGAMAPGEVPAPKQ